MRKVILTLLLASAMAMVVAPIPTHQAQAKSLYAILDECCKAGDPLCCTGRDFLDWF